MPIRRPSEILPALLAGALAVGTGSAAAATVSTAHLKVEFGDPLVGTPVNQDRVDAIAWRSSSGEVIRDWVASGGFNGTCGDVIEFFGESSFVPAGSARPALGSGTWTRWYDEGGSAGVSKSRPQLSCASNRPVAPVNTRYEVPDDALVYNQMTVVREWKFDAGTDAGAATALRSYVPRLPAATYRKVLLPSSSSAIVEVDVFGCTNGCARRDWIGGWFAMENDLGRGLMVIRGGEPPKRRAARLNVRYDILSQSNATAIEIKRPAGGFRSTVTETQYLCFYDAVTWPAAQRAMTYPAGCGIRRSAP